MWNEAEINLWLDPIYSLGMSRKKLMDRSTERAYTGIKGESHANMVGVK